MSVSQAPTDNFSASCHNWNQRNAEGYAVCSLCWKAENATDMPSICPASRAGIIIGSLLQKLEAQTT